MSIEDKIANEVTKLAPEIYGDLVKPTAQEVGSVAGRTAKALLSPVRGFLWSWEKIEDLVVEGVSKRLVDVPETQRKTPDPEIAVPLIQSLTYTAQNETLRELYLNLLANSMNRAMEKSVHPSFVEIIKQINSLDAKILDRVATESGYQKAINPNISVKNTRKSFAGVSPEWFVGWKIDEHDIHEISSGLVRLSKFGLIELMFDRTAGKEGYDELKSHPELVALLKRCQTAHPSLELEVTGTNSIFYLNEYGKQFKKACK